MKQYHIGVPRKTFTPTIRRNSSFFENLPHQQNQMWKKTTSSINRSLQLFRNKPKNAKIFQIRQKPKDDLSKYQLKWLGVSRKIQSDQSPSSYQAFPKRPHNNSRLSMQTLIIKYANTVKNRLPIKEQFKSLEKSQPIISNSATIRVKPRLSWFDKNKEQNKHRKIVKSFCETKFSGNEAITQNQQTRKKCLINAQILGESQLKGKKINKNNNANAQIINL